MSSGSESQGPVEGRVYSFEPAGAGAHVEAAGACPRCGAVLPPEHGHCRVCGLSRAGADALCTTCGYSLAGLPDSGVCPECGTDVARSRRGDLLWYCSEPHLKKLLLGALLVEWGAVAVLAAWVLSVVLPLIGVAFLAPPIAPARGGLIRIAFGSVLMPSSEDLLILVVSLVWAAGWWILSETEPGREPGSAGGLVRRWLRIILLVDVGLRAVELAFASQLALAPLSSWVFVLIGFGLYSAKFFVSMALLREFARRMPDPALDQSVQQFLWLGPVLFAVGIVACFTGPIIATGLYISLVDRVRFDLKRIVAIVRRGVDIPAAPSA